MARGEVAIFPWFTYLGIEIVTAVARHTPEDDDHGADDDSRADEQVLPADIFFLRE